jgi:hypothetical protein
MPVRLRNPDIRNPAIHKRPTTTTDAYGNVIGNGPDAPVTTTNANGECRVAVIPTTLRRSPYLVLSGGQEGYINMRRWTVAVIGAPTLVEGDLIDVTALPNASTQSGKYRCEVVNPTPPGEQIVLAQCLKE